MEDKFNSEMKRYSYNDGVYSFEGAVSVYQCGNYVTPMRIDCDHMDLFPVLNEIKGRQASGVRLCFTTDTRNLILQIANTDENLMLDLFVDDKLFQSIVCREAFVKFEKLPEGFKDIKIWLDPKCVFKLKNVLVESKSKICKTIIKQKRWIHYGSSISHSMEGESPSKIWTAMVGQKLNLHLTNLGFHSECKCEPMIGFMIRYIPADYITLKLGINLVDGDLNTRTFKPSILGLIKIIRDKKPNTPIVLCSPIYCSLYEETKGGSGYDLRGMREEILECVNIFKRYRDNNIFYVDGLKIFGKEYSEYMPDKLHPNAEGQYIMSENFINEVFQKHLITN